MQNVEEILIRALCVSYVWFCVLYKQNLTLQLQRKRLFSLLHSFYTPGMYMHLMHASILSNAECIAYESAGTIV